jgi:hypothetical protein
MESRITQGDLVGLRDAVGLHSPKAFAQTLAGLPQELERVSGAALDSVTLQISPMLLDQVRLKSRSDFVGCLQGVIDSPVPRSVVNHAVSIALLAGSLRAGVHEIQHAATRCSS